MATLRRRLVVRRRTIESFTGTGLFSDTMILFSRFSHFSQFLCVMEALLENDQIRDQVVDLLSERQEILETNQLQARMIISEAFTQPRMSKEAWQGSECSWLETRRERPIAVQWNWPITLPGLYPDWWEGVKYTKPVKAWAAGNTSNNTRDIVQYELLGEPGDPEQFGKGTIPKHLIISTERQPGFQMQSPRSSSSISPERTRSFS